MTTERSITCNHDWRASQAYQTAALPERAEKYHVKYLVLIMLFFRVNCQVLSMPVTDTVELKLQGLQREKKLGLLLKAAEVDIKPKPVRAISYAIRAMKLAREMHRQDQSAEACLLISKAYLNLNNSDSALFFAQKSIGLFRLSGMTEGILKASNNLGLVYLGRSNTEKAEKIFLQTFTDCNVSLRKNPSGLTLRELAAEVFNNLNLTYIRQGSYQKAKEKLLEFSKKQDYGPAFTGMIIQRTLAGVYQALGQYDSSLYYAENSLRIAQSLKDPLITGRIYNDIGTTHYYMGKCSEALDYYEKARKILLPVNDKPQLAKLYNNMASTYKQISYYEKATYYYLESARLKEALADSDGLAATYNNLALVYFDWDNNAMTRIFLDKAVSYNLKRKHKSYLATNYTALGDLFMDLKQADSALFYYRKSLELKTEMGNKFGIVISLHCLGDVYSELLLNEPRAMEYYQQALALANSIGSGFEIAGLNVRMGELLFRKGRLAAANEMFRKALDYAGEENSLELIQKCCRYLTEISILAGDKAAARVYFNHFRVTGDSIFSEDKTKAILEMQTRFETEKKEQDNLMLQKANDLQQAQIRILAGVAILFLILGFVIFYLYRQKSKAYRQIVRKNLEIVKAEKQMEVRRSMVAPDGQSMDFLPADEIENTTLGLMVKFSRLMKEEKPYLEARLTVDDICRKISTNRSYLSQMIREHYNQNFNGHLNELRIKEARRLLAEPENDHISIEGIGSMSGFSNKVTFHTTFRKQIGVTPAYFRKSMIRS